MFTCGLLRSKFSLRMMALSSNPPTTCRGIAAGLCWLSAAVLCSRATPRLRGVGFADPKKTKAPSGGTEGGFWSSCSPN
jgi:hypothetical protein